MKTFSNDMAPLIVVLALGPVLWTAGERLTAASSVRVVGSAASVSALKLAADCTVLTNVSPRPVTVTTSLRAAGFIVTETLTGCVAATSRRSVAVPKPVSSNVTVYGPGGRKGNV